jgi:hypothetical protein
MSANTRSGKKGIAGITTRRIQIPTDPITLQGELAMPVEPCGLILVPHCGRDAPDPKNKDREITCLLQEAGFGTLFLNLLTPAEIQQESQGRRFRFNIGLLTQRLVSTAHWISGEDEARYVRLGFLGSDTGAAAALVAAADLGSIVGAVVSCNGRPDLAGNALRRLKTPSKLILTLLRPEDEQLRRWNHEAHEMLTCTKSITELQQATATSDEPALTQKAGSIAAEWFRHHLQPVSGTRSSRNFRRLA